MSRFLNICVICFFSLLSLSVCGQDMESYQISLHREKITSLNLQIQELSHEIDSLRDITGIDEKKDLRQVLKSLEKRKTNLEDDNGKLQERIDEKMGRISFTQEEIEGMNVFVDRQIEEKYARNKKYLKRRYSNMSSDTLRLFDKEVEQYREMSDFDDYKLCIEEAIKSKKFYDKLSDAINRACTPDEIWNMAQELRVFLNAAQNDATKKILNLTSEQFSELDSLNIKLSRYINGVKELKKIVSAVNNNSDIKRIRDGKDYSRKEKCSAMIGNIIDREMTELVQDSEGQNINQRYFEMIPYLKKLLEDYRNELQKDPINVPTDTEIIITTKLEVE